MLSISTFGQTTDTSWLVLRIDSIVNIKSNYIANDCNTVELLTGDEVYKCRNYYFTDSSKKFVAKVSISFDNLPEELIYHFEKNKVIKAERNVVTKRKIKNDWTLYFDDDKQVLA